MARKSKVEGKVAMVRAARFRVDYEVMKAMMLLPDGAVVGSARETNPLGVKPFVEVVVSHPSFPEVGEDEDYPLGDMLYTSDGAVPQFVCFVISANRYAEGEAPAGRRGRALQLLELLRHNITDEVDGKVDVTGWGRLRSALAKVDELIRLTQ